MEKLILRRRMLMFKELFIFGARGYASASALGNFDSDLDYQLFERSIGLSIYNLSQTDAFIGGDLTNFGKLISNFDIVNLLWRLVRFPKELTGDNEAVITYAYQRLSNISDAYCDDFINNFIFGNSLNVVLHSKSLLTKFVEVQYERMGLEESASSTVDTAVLLFQKGIEDANDMNSKISLYKMIDEFTESTLQNPEMEVYKAQFNQDDKINVVGDAISKYVSCSSNSNDAVSSSKIEVLINNLRMYCSKSNLTAKNRFYNFIQLSEKEAKVIEAKFNDLPYEFKLIFAYEMNDYLKRTAPIYGRMLQIELESNILELYLKGTEIMDLKGSGVTVFSLVKSFLSNWVHSINYISGTELMMKTLNELVTEQWVKRLDTLLQMKSKYKFSSSKKTKGTIRMLTPPAISMSSILAIAGVALGTGYLIKKGLDAVTSYQSNNKTSNSNSITEKKKKN